ncbi:short chain dehydrogenase [Gracilaria domingensis]|nr:short chain dehydrogenase [Gracilaria domingensis]
MSELRTASALPKRCREGGPKIAVVTGASRGLGLALASKLLDNSFVVICAQRTSSILASTHGNALNVPLDLNQAQNVELFAQRMVNELPYIDLLINNAAICPEDHFVRDVHPPWNQVMQLNFFAQVHLTERLLPLLDASSSFPRVINISSGDGELVFFAPKLRNLLSSLKKQKSVPHLVSTLSTFVSETLEKHPSSEQEYVFHVQPAYRSSKAALNCYTCVAASRAQEKGRVSFVSVCPGDVDTSMYDPGAIAMTPVEAVGKMTTVLDVETACLSGKFLRYGIEIDW